MMENQADKKRHTCIELGENVARPDVIPNIH
jgi:hypothetical protein